MKAGDLVRVRWGGTRNQQDALGEVLSYEPDCHGGSWMYTARWGRNVEHTIDTAPKRGRVLVLLYEDGGTSWWDEKDIELMGGDDGV